MTAFWVMIVPLIGIMLMFGCAKKYPVISVCGCCIYVAFVPAYFYWLLKASVTRFTYLGLTVSGDYLGEEGAPTETEDVYMPISGKFLKVWLIIQYCCMIISFLAFLFACIFARKKVGDLYDKLFAHA